MTYTIKRAVYAKEDGTITHESGDGKNRVVLVPGAVISHAKAEELKLAELDAATDAREIKAADSLTDLKEPAASELKLEDDKATKTAPHRAPAKTEVQS